jgi:hypothetical protein
MILLGQCFLYSKTFPNFPAFQPTLLLQLKAIGASSSPRLICRSVNCGDKQEAGS